MQGTDVALGVVSDEKGIEQLMLGTVSKKRAKQLIEEFSQASGALVETSLRHVATILEQAHQKNLELKTEISTSYLELRPWLLENVALLDHAVVFDHLPESSAVDQPLTRGEVDFLLEQEAMLTWTVEYEKVKPFMEQIAAIHESPIILTETQKATRMIEIREKCARTVFPPEKSELLKRRLEEMAYYLLKRNDEQNAYTCLKSSASLNNRDSLFGKSLFIERLVERSMAIFDAAREEGFARENRESGTGSGPVWNP